MVSLLTTKAVIKLTQSSPSLAQTTAPLHKPADALPGAAASGVSRNEHALRLAQAAQSPSAAEGARSGGIHAMIKRSCETYDKPTRSKSRAKERALWLAFKKLELNVDEVLMLTGQLRDTVVTSLSKAADITEEDVQWGRSCRVEPPVTAPRGRLQGNR